MRGKTLDSRRIDIYLLRFRQNNYLSAWEDGRLTVTSEKEGFGGIVEKVGCPPTRA
jgi:hypothetical protein